MIINWGDAPFKAFITVTYPRGTCTVTLGSESYSHSGGGTHTFTVKKKGNWAVEIKNSTATKSSTANITKNNQAISITLNYKTYLFDNGAVVPWVGSRKNPTASVGTTLYVYVASDNSSSSISTKNKIDVSGYNSLHFVVSEVTGETRHWIGMGTNQYGLSGLEQSGTVAGIYTVSKGTHKINISSKTGSYYVNMAVAGTASNPRGLRVKQVWLE